MKMKNYLILGLIALCFVFYLLWNYERDKKQNIIFENSPLPVGVHAQVVNTPNKTLIKISSGTGVAVQTVPNYPESQIILNIQDDGGYNIEQNIWGLCLRPALVLGYSENINIGISARILFYRDFGAFAGLTYDIVDKDVNIIAGADFRLRIFTVPNISIFAGYSSDSRIMVGFKCYFK